MSSMESSKFRYHGSCAGGAYLPIMTRVIVEGIIFLCRSYLVKAAETIDNETLGGATTHMETGVTDYECRKTTKTRLTKWKTSLILTATGANKEKL
jgi:acetyl-CoA carboxylase carboxyltransferase component